MIDNFEAVAKAHGVFKGLRRAQTLDARVASHPRFVAFQALVFRALSLPEEPTCAELLSLYDAFLTWTAQYGDLPSGGAA
jgi:hypothetical protein